jgi:hypothetical protein
MDSALLERTPCFLRHASLGSEAVYEVLEEDAGIVTAAVVHAPGLEPGTCVRLMASAARAMERIENGAGTQVRRFIAPAAPARDRLSERLVAAVARPRAFRSS